MFSNILVPVVDAKSGEQAVRLACGLAKKGKGKICAVYVIAVRRSLPVDAEIPSEILKAEDLLNHMESVAEEEDYEVETDLLQAREVGPAIIDEAIERGVDLILMGIAPKRRFGQFSLGDVAPYVLKNAPCQIILYQYTTPTVESK